MDSVKECVAMCSTMWSNVCSLQVIWVGLFLNGCHGGVLFFLLLFIFLKCSCQQLSIIYLTLWGLGGRGRRGREERKGGEEGRRGGGEREERKGMREPTQYMGSTKSRRLLLGGFRKLKGNWKPKWWGSPVTTKWANTIKCTRPLTILFVWDVCKHLHSYLLTLVQWIVSL